MDCLTCVTLFTRHTAACSPGTHRFILAFHFLVELAQSLLLCMLVAHCFSWLCSCFFCCCSPLFQTLPYY